MKIAVYYEKSFEEYTIFEKILEDFQGKDKARIIISDLNRTGACVRPIKGSSEAVIC